MFIRADHCDRCFYSEDACQSVCLSVMRAGSAEAAKQFSVLFGVDILGDLTRVRYGSQSPRASERGLGAALPNYFGHLYSDIAAGLAKRNPKAVRFTAESFRSLAL